MLRATGFAAWPAATPSSCGPATAAVCVVRKQMAVMLATRRRHGEARLAVDGGGGGRWLPGPGGVGTSTPHGQGRSGRCLGETAAEREGFRCWASAWGTAVQQRLLSVADGARTSDERHRADVHLGGRWWPECQLFDAQLTAVTRQHGLAPRTAAHVQRDGLKSTRTGRQDVAGAAVACRRSPDDPGLPSASAVGAANQRR